MGILTSMVARFSWSTERSNVSGTNRLMNRTARTTKNIVAAHALAAILLIGACGTDQTPVETTSVPESSSLTIGRPNIVFILVDDLGYSDIGAYNSETFYETPNVDALARDGVLFTNGYAANPVCSPSRAAIITGKHPTRLQATEWFHINDYPHRVERFRPAVNKDYLDESEVTLAEVFKANGYRTAFLGKWHLGEEAEQFPQNQGFDVNIGGTGYGHPPGGFFSPYENPSIEDGPDGEYLTDRLTQEAINLIEGYAGEGDPFLLYLSFYTVHTPLQAPDANVEKYETKKASMDDDSPEFAEETQYFVSEPPPRRVRVRQNHPTYAAMVEKMDQGIGRVLDALERAGLSENTIVVFTSDNGGLSTSEGLPTSNLPLRGGKGWLYEGGIRVPFIVRLPGDQSAGTKSDIPAIGMDFLPTLTRLAGIDPTDIEVGDGIDLSPVLLDGKEAGTDRPIFWHYPHYSNQGGFPGAAVRVGKYKLIQNFEDGSLQLFDLSADIEEQYDLSREQPETVSVLEGLLSNWYQEVDARFMRPREGDDAQPWTPTQ